MKNLKAISFSIILILGSVSSSSQTPFWKQTSLDSSGVFTLASNPQGDVFAFTIGRYQSSFRFYRSIDNGDNWDTLDMGVSYSLFWVSCIATDSNGGLYAGVVSAGGSDTLTGVYYSSDNGDAWQRRSAAKGVHALMTPDNGKTFLIGVNLYGAGGVFRSVDSCRTWTRLTPDSCFDHNFVSHLAVTHQGTILAALDWESCAKYGVIRSTNNGQSWTRHGTWSGGGNVHKLFIPPMGDIFLVTGYDGVNRSSSDGAWWDYSNRGLPPSVGYAALAMDSNGTMYVGNYQYNGVYRSTDNGITWAEWNNGLVYDSSLHLSQSVQNLVVNSSGYIFAGTARGVFRSVNPLTAIGNDGPAAQPADFYLFAPFPNPFNPSTIIQYSLPHAEHVSLSIYDVLGREIVTLVNEKKEAGSHQVTWNAGNSPSGIYLCRMRAGGFGETRKLLLLR